MRINTNISALNAHRQLGINTNQGANAMERLSSGLRINRAGDDAAGLAISEKMRGQIRGLKQASRNAQDGISLIQTAEGALNETHSILQRMRELATQASTDTNTLTDRKEIQKELNQLLEEIDRIGDQTEFNTQKLIDGTYKEKIFHIGANQGQSMNINIGDMRTEALGGGAATAGTHQEGSEAVAATGVLEGVTFTAKTPGADGNDIEIKFVDPGSNNASLSVNVTGTTITVNLATGSSGDITSTVENIVSAINGDNDAKNLVEASGTGSTVVDAGTTNLTGGVDAVEAGIEGASAAVPASGTTVVDGETVTITGGTGEAYNGVTIKFEGGAESSTAVGAAWEGNTLTITLEDGEDYSAEDIESLIGNATGAPEGVNSKEIKVTVDAEDNWKVTGAKWAAADDVTLESLTNIASLKVKDEDIASVTTETVDELANPGVLTQKGADVAITNINNAIEQVSAERSKLGAVQNRLEHTIANLGTSAENLQAAESRIRDLDMAEEIMEFTKSNILNQAATAMLAQANMAPQTVLQLLG